MRRFLACMPLALIAGLAGCAPQGGTAGQTASAGHHAYVEPDTGSLFGGNANPPAGSAVNDPSMGNHISPSPGH